MRKLPYVSRLLPLHQWKKATLIDNGLVIFDWFVPSMRMQIILDSSFARPGSAGSAPIWGGKKGEFRDWTNLQLEVLQAHEKEYASQKVSIKVNFFEKFAKG